MNRTAGILLSVSSLPSKYGIGCFSKSAYEFADWLKEAGQSYWQILPLGPTSYGDSPYQSFSTYAGNPYFISLEDLIEEGVLTEKECEKLETESKEGTIDYKKLYEDRYPILRKAYERSNISENPDYQQFLAENEWWLSDYALFMAVKDRFEGRPWTEWAEDIRLRYGYAMDYYRRELYFDIEFQKYLQFTFYKQWNKLKAYVNSLGIRMIGDIPIYVAMDSADAWARINRDLVSRMQYDRLSQIQLLRRNNLFCVSDFQVRIFRTNINKFRNRFFRPAQRDFFYKFSDLIKEHRRNGFFVTSYKKCSYSRYDHQ